MQDWSVYQSWKKSQSLQKWFYLISTSLPRNIPSQRFVSKHPLPGNIAATKILSGQVVINRKIPNGWNLVQKKPRFLLRTGEILFVLFELRSQRQEDCWTKLDGYIAILPEFDFTSIQCSFTKIRAETHTSPEHCSTKILPGQVITEVVKYISKIIVFRSNSSRLKAKVFSFFRTRLRFNSKPPNTTENTSRVLDKNFNQTINTSPCNWSKTQTTMYELVILYFLCESARSFVLCSPNKA